jgi:hypothetical protein
LFILANSSAMAADLRPLRSNRPGRTESPFTADPGHLQVETDFFNYVQDRFPGTDSSGAEVKFTEKAVSVAGTNLRTGLNRWLEAEAYVQPYISDSLRGGADSDHLSGTGDSIVAFKANLAGNDSGKFAIAVMPQLVVPTSRKGLGERQGQPGFLLPWAFQIGEADAVFGMLKLQRTRSWDDSAYATVTGISLGLSHSFTAKTGAYAEFYNEHYDDRSDPVSYADFGVTYLATPELQLDIAGSFALNRAAADFNVLSGVATRF